VAQHHRKSAIVAAEKQAVDSNKWRHEKLKRHQNGAIIERVADAGDGPWASSGAEERLRPLRI